MTVALLFQTPAGALVPPTDDQLAYGPAGIEAIHDFGALDDLPSPHLNLNDLTVWPRYKVHKIGGFHSQADQDDPRFSPVGQMGERPLDPAIRRGKTITFEGDIIGRTLAEVRAGGTFLRNALANIETVLDCKPNPAYTPAYHTFCFGRGTQYQGDDQQLDGPGRMPSPYIRPFVLAFRLSDPRFFYSYKYDTGWATYNVGLGYAQHIITPKGAAPTEPLIFVKGPARDVEIRHLYGGHTVRLGLTGINLGGFDQVTFDFAARTIIRQSDAKEVSGLLTSQSDWWDSGVPGLSPIASPKIQLAGTDMTVATSLRARFYAATY